MPRSADVDGRRSLRIDFGGVDVRPRGRMQYEAGSTEVGRRWEGDIPLLARTRVCSWEFLGERAAELAARTRDQDALSSRSDRIGDVVLQRWTTRGSSQGRPCSSGSAGSYSSLTWYSISTSVRASKPWARLPGT
jgi:hypothetical protein